MPTPASPGARSPEGSAPARAERPTLASRVPPGGAGDPDEILDAFLGWVADQGLEPYAQQEEALLELMLGRHVVLSTPTGSGKSLVAQGLHFRALCEGRRSFYTSPVKALASEKFFAWCDDFGAENVGMLTGDASINPDAPILCCTTEVLANMALRQGAALDAPYVVLDEFHFYADRERGISWQIPLLVLRETCFLLMSATLGNTAPLEARLRSRTGRPVTCVHSDERPVPLDFEYRETPLHETLEHLVGGGRSPVYVVHFTQRECSEQAQGLTSANLCSREERRVIAEEMRGARFDTAYGTELQRLLRHGVAVHHAGLLPRYRLLVEQLAQRGLLKVICGTDTLGVGVNIPIRTVVFSRLSKFDGEKVSLLGVREFKQIAGRAGRRGFDEQGSVVCQAPEHVIENRRLAARQERRDARGGGRRRRDPPRKKPPRGFVPWTRQTFESLIERSPEMLRSRFDVSHGMLVNVLQRPAAAGSSVGYPALLELIESSHESDASRARLRRKAAALFRSLRQAGVVEVRPDPDGRGAVVRVSDALQDNFSLHASLSLYLVEAVTALDPESAHYAPEVLTLVEAILEDPRQILVEQVRKRKSDLLARLKAEGVPYEERIRQLDEVSHPAPDAEFIEATFRIFAQRHPWVRDADVRPKSIAREMFEGCRGFSEYAREYGLARSEGVLLRYLSQVHNTLVSSVPQAARTEEVVDVIAFLRTMLQRVDSSLVEQWEKLLEPGGEAGSAPAEAPPFDLASQPGILAARLRAELHAVLRAVSVGDFAEAVAGLAPDPEDPWDAARLEAAFAPYFEEYGAVVVTPEARRSHHTLIKGTGPRTWDVFQVVVDPEGDNLWSLAGAVDLSGQRDSEDPLVRLRRVGT